MSDETVATAPVTETSEAVPAQSLKEILAGGSKRPAQEQIDAWKTQYGSVFVSGFDEDELYIWRPMNRREYKLLQAKRAELTAKAEQGAQILAAQMEAEWEETICSTCILWPTLKENYWSTEAKAGAPSTLAGQIMTQSAFLNPQAASYLVEKL